MRRDGTVVEAKSGKLQGDYKDGLVIFKGIPDSNCRLRHFVDFCFEGRYA